MTAKALLGAVPPVWMAFTGRDAEDVIDRMRRGRALGAEGFCLQTCYMEKRGRTREAFSRILRAAGALPVYVTNYRHAENAGIDDARLAEGLVTLAERGAAVCDVMGDLFDPRPEEMTADPSAVAKQRALIGRLHDAGSLALISAHVYRFLPPREVLELALRQQDHGADLVKLVTYANSPGEEAENLEATALLKETLEVPFLFLSNGVSARHRFEGPLLGSCLYLGCLDDTAVPKPSQPSVAALRAARDRAFPADQANSVR